jgi:hypothetical protein
VNYDNWKSTDPRDEDLGPLDGAYEMPSNPDYDTLLEDE